MLCNYLQNVAAITYIFVLQLSTFLFYNKQLLLLSICELIFNNSIVKVISFIYMLHVFNLCPCFGDGKIVVKIIVKYLKCFIDNKK